MKFASLPKFPLLPVLAAFLILLLVGCGATNNLALTQGNWSMTATSSGAVGTLYIGGNLTQIGSILAGSMLVIGSCIDPSHTFAFSGTVNGNKVTLNTASASGEVITVTATGTIGSALTGTYTVTGGCDDGDSGTITAAAVPSINATWSGPISGSGGSNVTLAIAFSQATTASADGTFPLTGTVTFTTVSYTHLTLPTILRV